MGIENKIQEHKSKAKKSMWAVWSWLVLAALLVGYFVYNNILQASDRRVLAKLKHERDVNEEKQLQAVTASKIEKIEDKKNVLEQEILARTAKSAKIDEEINLRHLRKEEAHEFISKIKDWNDIDSSVVFRNKSGGS